MSSILSEIVQAIGGCSLAVACGVPFMLLLFGFPLLIRIHSIGVKHDELSTEGARIRATVVDIRTSTTEGTDKASGFTYTTIIASGTHPQTGQTLTFRTVKTVDSGNYRLNHVGDSIIIWVSLANPSTYLFTLPSLVQQSGFVKSRLSRTGSYIVAQVSDIRISESSEGAQIKTYFTIQAKGMHPQGGQVLTFQTESTKPPEYKVGEPITILISLSDPAVYVFGS